MKRVHIDLQDIASLDNLAHAFWRAARGSPHDRHVRGWREGLESELASLRHGILSGHLTLGDFRVFHIRDPKPRTIHAPSFRERVLHHAVMALVGPVLDRALVADTYACRVAKGAHAAVERAQCHLRAYRWFVQIDVRAYFASVAHDILKSLLARRIKGGAVLDLLATIIDAHHDGPGRGLPIGALTSQHFANFYLAGLDRYLLEDLRVRGMVRYMDDVVWWCDDHEQACQGLRQVSEFLTSELSLEVKPQLRTGPSHHGLRFCGFHVGQGALLLSPRRRQRYAQARRKWETAFALGLVDGKTLQAGYASAQAITAHADARGFRRQQLVRVPPRIAC